MLEYQYNQTNINVMKRKIFSIILSVFFLFLSNQSTSAQTISCFHIAGGCGSMITCGSVCCATQQDCNNYNGSSSGTGSSAAMTCNGGNGIDTAIGCIPIGNTEQFVGWILGWAVGVGGGIAFLLIVYASFMVMTSSGDPARLKTGQEILTSAISGLIMLLFSVVVLRFIGIDILGLDKL